MSAGPGSTAARSTEEKHDDQRATDRTENHRRQRLQADPRSDILHPQRPNISQDELREKLGGLYKASKEQVSVFGLRTQFGGGKTTGFALIYDSPEALQKFEPLYRLVRIGKATRPERASRQQRACRDYVERGQRWLTERCRQAAQEQAKDSAGHGKGQGRQAQEGQIDGSPSRWIGSDLDWSGLGRGGGGGSFCKANGWESGRSGSGGFSWYHYSRSTHSINQGVSVSDQHTGSLSIFVKVDLMASTDL